jgi:hypothetical protein
VLSVVLTCVDMGLLSLAILHNGLDSFIWWSNALVFFAALTYTGVNVANSSISGALRLRISISCATCWYRSQVSA